ncbi:MAG: hypothetical protein KAH10_05900 [Flavobacteriales bacterium]|nr:hypothetical protein [Flavobacteriales bacterium]
MVKLENILNSAKNILSNMTVRGKVALTSITLASITMMPISQANAQYVVVSGTMTPEAQTTEQNIPFQATASDLFEGGHNYSLEGTLNKEISFGPWNIKNNTVGL